jgi:ribosomal protein S18 acetylase RimI-like enzyme
MMVCFVPLMTVLLAIPMFRTYPSKLQLVGVLGGLVCIGLIMREGVDRQVPPGQLALALSVPLGFAYTNLTTRKHLNTLPPYVLTFCCVALVALALVPVALVAEPMKAGGDTGVAVASVVTLGVASTAFSLVIFFRLLQRRGALYAGMVTYLVPLVAVLWGWADAEEVTARQLLALLGVLAMVAVVQVDLARGFGGRVELCVLDHTNPDQSERIRDVMRAAYAAEGRLIGVEDFAPLRRESDDIRAAASTFYGYVTEGRLVGVAEIEQGEGGAANIAGFVVHPAVSRQGIGSRLLRHVLEATGSARFTVSTAAANAPAIAFYETHGFQVRDHWVIDGIDMVTLEL